MSLSASQGDQGAPDSRHGSVDPLTDSGDTEFDIDQFLDLGRYDEDENGQLIMGDMIEELLDAVEAPSMPAMTSSAPYAGLPGTDLLRNLRPEIIGTVTQMQGRAVNIPQPGPIMLAGDQFTLRGPTVPQLLNAEFHAIADAHYGPRWTKALTLQINMLTAAMLATPGTTSLRLCRISAADLWKELFRQKIEKIKDLYPGLQFRRSQGPIRDHLLTTLAVIQRTYVTSSINEADTDLTRGRLRFQLELLRWEAAEMSDFSRVCNNFRKYRMQQYGVTWRIIDGFYFDMANLINFRMPQAHRGSNLEDDDESTPRPQHNF